MKRHVLYSSAAILAAIVPQTAFAQDTGADVSANSSTIPDDGAIIVTARRRAEDVSKVPISITAFSGEQLAAKGIRTTEDLGKVTPGLNFSMGGSRTSPFVVMRGQSRAVTGNSSAGVIIYQNDVPQPNFGAIIPTFDMANVQVLKGPQGTLFGRNSIGGAILAVTEAPKHEFGGYVSGTLQQYDTYSVEGAINVPIVQDRIALRLSAQVGHETIDVDTKQVGFYTINPNTFTWTPGAVRDAAHEAGEYAMESYRASLLIEPTDWLKNTTVADYTKIRGAPAAVAAFDTGQGLYTFPTLVPDPNRPFLPTILAAIGQGADPSSPQGQFAALYAGVIVPSLAQCTLPGGAPGPLNCNYLTANAAVANAGERRVSYTTQEEWASRAIIKGLVNTTTANLGDNHQLKNIFGIRITDTYSNNSLNGYPIPVINTATRTQLSQITNELQLSGSFFENDLKYSIGGFYFNEKPNGIGGYQTLELNTFFGLASNVVTTYLHNTSKAVYGQFDYSLDKLIPGLSVTAGLRQTWDTQSACAAELIKSPFAPQMTITSPENAPANIPTEQECLANISRPAGTTYQIFPDANFKKLTYTLGANWQLTPDAMVYVAHRRGYRAGGYNTPLFDPYLAEFQTFGPETLTDWEVGAKLRFQSGGMRGTLNIAVYQGKDTQNQLALNTSNLSGSNAPCIPDAIGTPGHTGPANCTTTGGTPGSLVPLGTATTTVTAGALTIRGVEADAAFSPFPGLTFTGNLSYTDIKVDSISLNPRITDFLTRAGIAPTGGITIQGQPTWTYNAGIQFQPQTKVAGGDLILNLDYRHTDPYTIVQLVVPAVKSLDARIGLDNIMGSTVSAAVWGRNLTDRVNYVGNSASSAALGMQSYILGAPRTFGMSVTYKFGG